MTIDRLAPAHAATYRALMLQAYAAHPDAFTSSVGERAALPLAWWEKRLDASVDAAEVVFGAWRGAVLTGVAGLSFDRREKARHKATLFGMVVSAEARGQGLGRQLVQAVLAHAGSRAGVRLVQLTVTDGNDGAEALYRQCGFVTFGVEPMAVRVDELGHAFVSKRHMWCDLTRDGRSVSPGPSAST